MHRFNKQLIVLQIKKQRKMKKLVFMFVAMAAISFASCGNKAEAPAADVDTTAVDTTDTTVVDTTAVDTTTAE